MISDRMPSPEDRAVQPSRPTQNEAAEVLFTLPGRIGDNLLRWPAVYHYWRKSQRQVVVGLDPESHSAIGPLLRVQPAVQEVIQLDDVNLATGPGGQPWDLGFTRSDYDRWTEVYHLGFRSHPDRNITRLSCAWLPFDVSDEELESPSLLPPRRPARNRCVLHGTLPGLKFNRGLYWLFLRQVKEVLRAAFSEVLFIGTPDERDYAKRQGFQTVATANFQEAAELLSQSQAVVAGPSSIAALAGLMQVPCLRVHDNNPHAPADTWANLGPFQVNYVPWRQPPRAVLRSFIATLPKRAIREPSSPFTAQVAIA